MKALFLSILLLISFQCFAQDDAYKNKLEKEITAKARQTPEYKKAVADIDTVRKNIALAKKGKLSTAYVVKDYNIRLAEAMGNKQTFKAVDTRVTNDGDKFIQYMLLTTAARLAREQAAKVNEKIDRLTQ